MERLPKQLLMSFGVLLLFAGGASADPVCTNDTNLHQYICYDTFGPTAGEFTMELPLPQFDPILGVLLQIDFNLAAHIVGSATLENNNALDKKYTVTLSEDVTLTDPNGVLVAETIPLFENTAFWVSAHSEGTLMGSADASDPGIVTMTSPFTAQQRATYIGSGDIIFSVVTTGASGFRGASETTFNSTVSTNGIAQVIYTYTDIPEPATMFLIGSSLLALGFMRKLKALSA